ncbi:hypothetical protein VB620_01950 [Nodularia harveyana UHCC-0300]|uniref:Secreted protein n=1 Tax=Nodularia harveyana UHCC-0300 TaxID=2974287 RepID=A0ABU5U988_9CYAN|nr:hypothetical protein [Nodularia harveyana]MEA5580100.1 hypothetical protein [Nodularia harveyana UHCC-0300]
MKKPFLSVTQISLLTVAGICFTSLLVAEPSLAQFNSVDRGTNQNSDPFAAPNTGELDVFDIIHRAQMGTINWNANEQGEKLDSAASDFRARQQKAFQEQQQSQIESPSSATEETQVP